MSQSRFLCRQVVLGCLLCRPQWGGKAVGNSSVWFDATAEPSSAVDCEPVGAITIHFVADSPARAASLHDDHATSCSCVIEFYRCGNKYTRS